MVIIPYNISASVNENIKQTKLFIWSTMPNKLFAILALLYKSEPYLNNIEMSKQNQSSSRNTWCFIRRKIESPNFGRLLWIKNPKYFGHALTNI